MVHEFRQSRRTAALATGIIVLSALLLTVFSCTTSTASLPDLAETKSSLNNAWAALWNNQFSEASAGFAKYQSDPRVSAQCHRGLALAAYAAGDIKGLYNRGLSALAAAPFSPESAALLGFVEQQDSPYPWAEVDKNHAGIAGALTASDQAPALRLLGDRFNYNLYRDGINKVWGKRPDGIIRPDSWKIAGPLSPLAMKKKPLVEDKDGYRKEAWKTVYTNLYGANVEWTPGRTVDADGTINPALWQGGSNATYYLASTKSIPADMDYWLVVDRACGMKLWIDGVAVLEDTEFRTGLNMHWIRKNLSRGPHEFMVMVNDKDGIGSFGLQLVPTDRDASFDVAANKVIRTLPGMELSKDGDHLIGKLAANVDAAPGTENVFWLAECLYRKGYPEAALSMLDSRADIQAKGSALFADLRYRILQTLGMPVEAEGQLAKLLESGALFVPAMEARILMTVAQNRLEEAEKLCGQLKDSGDPDNHSYKVMTAFTKLTRDGVANSKELDTFAKEFPRDQSLNHLVLTTGTDNIDSNLLARTIKAQYFPLRGLERLYRFLRSEEEYSRAADVAARLKLLEPGNPRSREYSIKSGLDGRDPSIALAEAIQEFPRDWGLLDFAVSYIGFRNRFSETTEGKVATSSEFRKENEKRYNDALKAGLAVYPDIWSWRKESRKLDKLEDLDRLVGQTDPLLAIKNYKPNPAFAGRDAIIVLDETDEVFFGDGASRVYHHQIVKLNSAMAVNQEGTQTMHSRNVDLKAAFAVRPDGSCIWGKRSGNRIQFQGLAPGDFVVLSYAHDDAENNAPTHEFWTSGYFKSNYPTAQLRYQVFYPKDRTIKYAMHNDPGTTITIQQGEAGTEFKTLTCSLKDMDRTGTARDIEYRDTYPWIDISSLDTWNPVIDWYAELADYRAEPTFPIRKKAAELTSGATTRQEKIRRLYDFAANQIRYEDLAFMYSAFVPQWADTVLRDRFGDCKDKACLFIALLRATGIKADFALSNSDYTGQNPFLPSNRFNHAIVLIPGGLDGTGKENLVIDPTSEFFTFPVLPIYLQQTRYLPIQPEAITASTEQANPQQSNNQGMPGLRVLPQINTSNTATSTDVSVIDLRPAISGSSIEGALILRGFKASKLRETMKSTDEGIKLDRMRHMLAQDIPGVRLEEAKALYTDSLSSSPVLRMKGSMGGLVATARAGQFRQDIPWGSTIDADWKDLVARNSGVESLQLDWRMSVEPQSTMLYVHVPDGYTLASVPADESFAFGNARAEFSYSLAKNVLTCTLNLSIPSMTVPRSDLPAFEEFLGKVYRKQTEFLQFNKN